MNWLSTAFVSAALLLGTVSLALAEVPFSRIATPDSEPGNWLTYSRSLNGQRYSPLKEIDAGNVKDLKVKWAYQMPDPFSEGSGIW